MSASEVRADARKRLAGKWGKAALLTLSYFAFTFVLGFVEGMFPKNIQWIPSLVVLLVSIPVAYGLIIQFLKLHDGESFGYFDFVSQGFSNFARSWKVNLWIFVKMLLPAILIVIAMILAAVGVTGAAASIYSKALFASSTWQSNLDLSLGDYNPQVAVSSNTGVFGILLLVASILYIVAIVWLIIRSYSFQLSQFIAIENPDLTAKDCVKKSAELMKGKKGKLFFLQLSFIGWAILCTFTLGIGVLWLMPYMQVATVVFYRNIAGKTAVQKVEENTNSPITEQ